jgi:hypothetical protein
MAAHTPTIDEHPISKDRLASLVNGVALSEESGNVSGRYDYRLVATVG